MSAGILLECLNILGNHTVLQYHILLFSLRTQNVVVSSHHMKQWHSHYVATCLAQSFLAAHTTNPGVFNSFAALLHSSSTRLGCKYVTFAFVQSILSVVKASDE